MERIIGVFLVLGVIGLLCYVINALGQTKREIAKMEDEEFVLPEGVFRRATVLKKKAELVFIKNSKTGKHERVFEVTFLVDGNEETYPVEQAWFDRLYEGQTSTLVTVNGNFFAFEEGEEQA